MQLCLPEVAEVIGACRENYPLTELSGVTIDWRAVQKNDLFFALPSEHLDKFTYIQAALHRGAVAAVVPRNRHFHIPKHRLLAVQDPQCALHTLAARARFDWGKVAVGITGSAGKTTTKEILGALLATRYAVFKSEDNLNGQIGLPLQALKLGSEHDLAVFEMGMSYPGELKKLALIAQLSIAIITGIGAAHIGHFASLNDIARAKWELVESLPRTGVAILNADDKYIRSLTRRFHGNIITFAIHNPADYRAHGIVLHGALGSEFMLISGEGEQRIFLPLVGVHNIYNALAAITAAIRLGVPPSVVRYALKLLKPVHQRGEVLKVNGATIIDDTYNSNPSALNSMIEAVASIPGKRHIVVVGQMLELGSHSEKFHRDCARQAAKNKVDIIIGVGGHAKYLVSEAAEVGNPCAILQLT